MTSWLFWWRPGPARLAISASNAWTVGGLRSAENSTVRGEKGVQKFRNRDSISSNSAAGTSTPHLARDLRISAVARRGMRTNARVATAARAEAEGYARGGSGKGVLMTLPVREF